MPPISIEQERISLSTNFLSLSIIFVSVIPLNLESLTITRAGTNHIFAGGRCPLSLLSPKQIPPHIRQDHSQGDCVVEDLVAPPGVEEVGDDAVSSDGFLPMNKAQSQRNATFPRSVLPTTSPLSPAKRPWPESTMPSATTYP